MENPFSAPPSEFPPAPVKALSTPPPLDDTLFSEASTTLPPIRPEVPEIRPPMAVNTTTDLPPIKEEPITQQQEMPKPPVSSVFAGTLDAAESIFDLETEEQKPIPSVPKPKPHPVSPSISIPAEPVAVHHQPIAYASPVGWSDADFDDHDGTVLPPLEMEEKSCRMCKYFHYENNPRSEVRFGECRRKAPEGVGKAVWPSVLWDSWCGEWQMGVGQEEMMQMARSVADRVHIRE